MTKEAENPITTELVKANVTDAVIQKLRTEFLPLKINGIDDKEGYEKVLKARSQCRDVRVLAEKVCKKGREGAVKIQKEWIAKEKEVVAKVTEVEQHLKKQEDDIDAQKEAIKIKAERLLKLPGRKEQLKGMEDIIDEVYDSITLDDDHIMSLDDQQWDKIVLLLKEHRFNKQQKIIDDQKAKELLSRTIERENELIAIGAVLYSDGIGKVYRKGNAKVTEQAVKECAPETWNRVVEEFLKAIIPESKPIAIYAAPASAQPKAPNSAITEASDEEKLFNYASALEKIEWPGLKSKEATEIFDKAQEKLNEAITILRQ